MGDDWGVEQRGRGCEGGERERVRERERDSRLYLLTDPWQTIPLQLSSNLQKSRH